MTARLTLCYLWSLTDLAKTLAKSDQVEVEYGVQSYYNPFEKKIYMSHFWKDRNHRDMVDGLKSDVYLRSIGSRYRLDERLFPHAGLGSEISV